jgi:hypothetical protein
LAWIGPRLVTPSAFCLSAPTEVSAPSRSSIASSTMAAPRMYLPRSRRVLAGSRWHTQNITRPSSAYTAWLAIAEKAFPFSWYAFTLVAEKTIVSPISSSRPELAISR